MTLGRLLWVGASLLTGCSASQGTVETTDPVPTNRNGEATTTLDGIYTPEQAIEGEQVAWGRCFECHSESEWARPDFLAKWSGQRLGDIFETIRRTMPLGAPGQFSAEEYAAVVAYMLRLQDLPAGETPLPSELERLDAIQVAPIDVR